jgi:PDZ domain-containing protein
VSDLDSVVDDADPPVADTGNGEGGPGGPGGPEGPAAPRRRSPALFWAGGTIALILVIGSILMSTVPLPYYTVAPGDAVDVAEKISVRGQAFRPDGDLMLLYVRQQARINGWQWVRAWLDSDIDLYQEKQYSGGQSPADLQTQSTFQMAQAQRDAKKVAFERLGYRVPFAPGLEVLAVFDRRPASGVLRAGDVIRTVEGTRVNTPAQLQRVLRRVGVGGKAQLLVERGGQEVTARVGLIQNPDRNDKRPVMGVYVSRRYDFPFDVTIDTADIGGPSAGLAMTLSVLDALSPADLLRGHKIAVTGTIDDRGHVGAVGGVGQKTVSARANGAEVMLVPADEVAEARARAKGLKIVGVKTVDDALRSLRAIGGDPLRPPAEVADRAA